MMIENIKYLYRYEEIRYSLGVDQFDNAIPGHTLKVALRKYKVVKKTNKGYRISLLSELFLPNNSSSDIDIKNTRFVLSTAKKKFACETIELAKESFIARKNRQLSILKRQIRDVEEALYIIQSNNDNTNLIKFI